MITVLCHGCFELLHPGHRAHLLAAKALGDRLVVSVSPDSAVRATKGLGRPIFGQIDRAAALRDLRYVDDVLMFNDATAVTAIEFCRPDVFAKGGDYAVGDATGHLELERLAVERCGGRLVILRSKPVYSSTAIVTGDYLAQRIAIK